MRVEMVMPQMGESIAEATILKWLKGVGDVVKKDETILEISTDKVDSEIPAPAAGTIVEFKAKEGEVVAVKSVIAVIETEAGAAKTASASSAAAPAPQAAPAAPKSEPKKPVAPQPASQPAPTAAPVEIAASASELPTHIGERFYSPLVRSLASENGISPTELQSIRGTGADGRVTKADLMAFLEHRAPQRSANGAGSAAQAKSSAKSQAPAPRMDYNAEGIRVEPMDNMRKRIAEHMVRSKATSAHVYSTAEVDVTNIARWRAAKQNDFVAREGFKLSFTPFFLEAVVKGLVQFPYINASVDGENLVLKRFINLGCAVALGTTGLIVPVIKNADQLSLVGLARSLNDLAARARSKKLLPDETQGGTFTVTNPGIFGNIMGCPIINQPQLAILGVGAIKKRPVVVEDMIAVRDIVYLTLSYDHRVIDGSLSGQFLQFMTNYLEGWDLDRELY